MSEVKTNKISSLASNNDITLDPDGSGSVAITNSGSSNALEIATHISTYEVQFTGSTHANLTANVGANPFYIQNLGAGNIHFQTSATDRMVIDSSGNVGIGTASPNVEVEISGSGEMLRLQSTDTNKASIVGRGSSADRWLLGTVASNDSVTLQATSATGELLFKTGGTNERARVNSAGAFIVGKTTTGTADNGAVFQPGQLSSITRDSTPFRIRRNSSDGTLIEFYQDANNEGSISVSGSTVSYNGGHLARWSQATDGKRIDGLVKGTVMTNLDQMAVWTKDGVTEDNEQLNCMAVSSVEGDVNVAGVFVNWDDDDEDYTADMNVAMTGDMVIRIAKDTTVARGDLLMSAGDGTAKPQGDVIVRSKTIAKVTSITKSHTYDDGSYLVPCVLMAC